MFDVVHDHGLSPALLGGKSKFVLFTRSYDAMNGAPDVIGEDNGRNKLDYTFTGDSSDSAVTAVLLGIIINGYAYNYTFAHMPDLDAMGHQRGWGAGSWFDTLQLLDTQLGRLLSAIENNPNPALSRELVLILTADHGGGNGGWGGTDHSQADSAVDYTVPVFVWGPGFSAGTDLYSMFANRFDPGSARMDYNAPIQPLRNGDTANLALCLLGLPSIPGSTLIPVMNTSAPRLIFQTIDGTATLSWPIAAARFTLESTDTLGPGANWDPIITGIQTNSDGFSYTPLNSAGAKFYRLRKQ